MELGPQFHIDVVAEGPSRTRIQLVGELDCSVADRAAEVLLELVRTANGIVVVDLADLSFCDSSGVRVLERVHTAAEQRPVRFVLQQASPPVRRVLEILGLAGQLLADHGGHTPEGPHLSRA